MPRRRKILLAILSILFLAILFGEAAFYDDMYPIQPGTSANFWFAATRVTLPGATSGIAFGPTLHDGERYIYATVGYHGHYLHRVPQSTALLDFPRVLAELATRAAANDPIDFAAEGFRRWSALPDIAQKTPDSLIAFIDEANTSRRVLADPSFAPYIAATKISESDRTEKSHFYWATLTFEILFFAMLLLWLAYPLWREYRLHRFLIFWCAAPFLFLLPHWFGFAATTRSPWGPSGGILYSQLLFYSPRPMENAEWELTFLRHFPPLLSAISQDMGGPIIAITGSASRGPLVALYQSIAFAVAIFIIHAARLKHAQDKSHQRGFEILPAKTPSPLPAQSSLP